jgi:hypothetical protein
VRAAHNTQGTCNLLIPSGNIAFNGATFFGNFSGGGQFQGRFFKRAGLFH